MKKRCGFLPKFKTIITIYFFVTPWQSTTSRPTFWIFHLIHLNTPRKWNEGTEGTGMKALASSWRVFTNNPWHSPGICNYVASCILSHDNEVLEIECSKIIAMNYNYYWSKANKNRSLITPAKNICDSWFSFLSSHSTTKPSSQKEGAWSDKITFCIQGHARDSSQMRGLESNYLLKLSF